MKKGDIFEGKVIRTEFPNKGIHKNNLVRKVFLFHRFVLRLQGCRLMYAIFQQLSHQFSGRESY